MENQEAVITIRTTESELECIIWALTAIKTVRIPVEPEWKIPYKSLLKERKVPNQTLLKNYYHLLKKIVLQSLMSQ